MAHVPRELVLSNLPTVEQRGRSWRASWTEWKENAANTQACSGRFMGDHVNPVEEVFASSFCRLSKQPQIGFKLILYLGECFYTNVHTEVSVWMKNFSYWGASCHVGWGLVSLMWFIWAYDWAGESAPQRREIQTWNIWRFCLLTWHN